MSRTPVLSLLLLTCLAAGCASSEPGRDVAAAMDGDAARPAQARWLRTELYLAVGRADGPAAPRIDAATWQDFLDEEVTPRFPGGFSVLDAYGQWRGRDTGRIGRLATKIIVILHPDTAATSERIDALRRAFKVRFGQVSVLRATWPVEVSF